MTNRSHKEQILRYRRINKHGEQLKCLYHSPWDAITLYNKVRLVEKRAQRLEEFYQANQISLTEYNAKAEKYLNKLHKILGRAEGSGYKIIWDHDPNSYVLKILFEPGRGKMVIAPQF